LGTRGAVPEYQNHGRKCYPDLMILFGFLLRPYI
jgi:hypothetical protein